MEKEIITNFDMALENRKIRGFNELLEKMCDNFISANCKLSQENESLKKKILKLEKAT